MRKLMILCYLTLLLASGAKGITAIAAHENQPQPLPTTDEKALRQLLKTCEQHFQANRLTTGDQGTALECYQQVLQQFPNNAEALVGLERIQHRYYDWIEQSLKRKEIDKTYVFLERLRLLNSESPYLIVVQQKLLELETELSTTPATTETPKTAAVTQSIFTDTLKDSSPGIVMIRLHAGRFLMGDSVGHGNKDENPVHWVTLPAFAISRDEITFAQYDHFAQVTQRPLPPDEGWGRGQRPVINVSWRDATAYAAWLSEQTGNHYRLPTEAEWEYAARAGTKSDYWWGHKISPRANCHQSACGDPFEYTAPVGHFMANPFGIRDMIGNVAEWTCSIYTSEYLETKEEQLCSTESPTSFVIRGGSWKALSVGVRASFRYFWAPDNHASNLGFRLVRVNKG